MMVECPRCDAENNDASRFCGNCAASLGQPGACPGGGPEGAILTRTLETPVQVMRAGMVIAGKYRVVEELGHGGMGVVYKAEDFKLKRFVALKFLPPHLMDSPELKERFLVEAQAAAALNHPNICTVFEVGEDEARPYIAMEFVDGETLKDKLRQGPLKADEVLKIAGQVAAGLGEAQHKGIIHRDIKSANIMVTAKGQAKVMDFGLAKLRGGSSLTKSQTTIGTVAYMSPEQARGQDLDPRTDIWSLGVVLYEMLAGKLPFRGDHDQAVIHQILHAEPESLTKARPDIPLGLDQIVGQALAKNPAARYQTMEDLGTDLEAVAEGLKPLKARPRRAARKIFGIRAAYVYTAPLIMLMLLFGLDVVGIRSRIIGKPGASVRAVRLAVLPFANLTGDPQQEFFSDGLTQQMNARLGGLNPEALSVIGNTSASRYKKTSTPIDQIGRELRVDYVLEGGAQREGTRVRITAVLIKTRDQTQVWSETFDRDASSVLALQSEVAQKVAGALALKLLPAEKARQAGTRQIDPAAYDAYLLGSDYAEKMTPHDLDTAERYFNQALQKQPDYAAAYVGLAGVWSVRYQNFISPRTEAVPKCKAMILKALELDDSSAEAHFALAAFYTWTDWTHFREAGPEWQRAIALDPNPAQQTFYAMYLNLMGRSDEALAVMKKALDADPFSASTISFYAGALNSAGRHDEAILLAKKALAIQPDFPYAWVHLFGAYYGKGMEKEASECLKHSYSSPDMQKALDRGFAEAGLRGATRRLAELTETLVGTANFMEWITMDLYVLAQDKEKALWWLERCYELKAPDMPMIGIRGSYYEFLRPDPRFQDILRKVGLPTDETKR
jgi:TolB-like protein/predicted Ser/Thr protein kinase